MTARRSSTTTIDIMYPPLVQSNRLPSSMLAAPDTTERRAGKSNISASLRAQRLPLAHEPPTKVRTSPSRLIQYSVETQTSRGKMKLTKPKLHCFARRVIKTCKTIFLVKGSNLDRTFRQRFIRRVHVSQESVPLTNIIKNFEIPKNHFSYTRTLLLSV